MTHSIRGVRLVIFERSWFQAADKTVVLDLLQDLQVAVLRDGSRLQTQLALALQTRIPAEDGVPPGPPQIKLCEVTPYR